LRDIRCFAMTQHTDGFRDRSLRGFLIVVVVIDEGGSIEDRQTLFRFGMLIVGYEGGKLMGRTADGGGGGSDVGCLSWGGLSYEGGVSVVAILFLHEKRWLLFVGVTSATLLLEHA